METRREGGAVARKAVFLILLAACALPWVSAAMALTAGIVFALTAGNPWPRPAADWSKRLLQLSVVGLGFGVSLGEVWRVGRHSLLFTAVGIVLTLAAGHLLGRLTGTERSTAQLVSFGTAICGGSAIAALAPVIKARAEEIAVALATVFTLNAVALLLFPAVGRLLHLDQTAFGLWAGVAIHDTSSVVGAASGYGPVALATATTVKLARTVWITPVVLAYSLRSHGDRKVKIPLFIVGFIAAAALNTFLPAAAPLWHGLAAVGKQGLVASLFLVGSGLDRSVLRSVGVRPLALGLALWILVSGATLAAVLTGVLSV